MSTNWPANNLPGESQAWRRKVEEALNENARSTEIVRKNFRAASQAQRALGRQISRAGLTIEEQGEVIANARRVPAAPTTPSVTSDAYFDDFGMPKASVFASCDPVLTDIDGKPIAIARHELVGRPAIAGESWRPLAETVLNNDPSMSAADLPAGEQWVFRMRAVSDSGVAGEFSAEIPVTLAKDTTPPPKPSTPTASSRLGQVMVAWDGKIAGGGSQPADFSHAEIFMAETVDGPGEKVGQIGTGGDTFYAPEQEYGDLRWYYLVSVDYAGNRSTPSERVEMTPQSLVDDDIADRVISGDHLKLMTIHKELLADGAVDASKLSSSVTDLLDSLEARTGEAVIDAQDEYATSTSATAPPSAGWSTTPPAWSTTNYIWRRVRWFYADETEDVSAPVVLTGNPGAPGEPGAPGADGQDGAPGSPGADGRGIDSTAIAYAKSTNGTTAPSTGWGTSIPTTVAGEFLWTRATITYTTGSPSVYYSVAAHGATGTPGAKGDDGADGRGIVSTTIHYATAASGTTAPSAGWQTAVPTVPAGQYLWTRTTVAYTSGPDSISYSVGRMGANGTNGTPGAPGANGQTSYFHVAYANSADGTADFSTSNPSGRAYMGTYTDFTEADSTTPGDYVWALIKGADGATGKGIASSAVHYAVSDSGVDAPEGAVETRRNYFDPSQINNLALTTSTVTGPGNQYRGYSLPVTPGEVYSFRRLAPLTNRYRVVFTATEPTSGISWFGGTGMTGAHDGLAVIDGITVPAGATHMFLYLSNTTQAVPGVLIERAATAGDYFDGNTPELDDDGTLYGYAWVDAEGESESVEFTYEDALNPPSAPTWVSGVPSTTAGQYLWSRTTITFTDGATQVTYAVARHGATGAAGAKGDKGDDGAPGANAKTVLLSNESHTFAGSTTAAVAGSTISKVLAFDGAAQVAATIGTITGQVTGLTTSIQNNNSVNAQFTVTVTTALTTQSGTLTVPVTVGGTALTKTFAWAVSRTGATGATGVKGDKGDTGAPGADAPVISLTATTQVLTHPATGGATTPPTAVVTGAAINTTINQWQYSTNGGTFSNTLPTGVTRSGNVVTITGATMTARTIAVRMASTTSGMADTLTVAKVADGATGAKGDTGNTGAPGSDGANITSVTRFYYLTSGSQPAKPTTMTPPAPWSTTEPGYNPANPTDSLYTTDRVVLSNGTFFYSDVSLSASFDAAKSAYVLANNALTSANGKNKVIWATTAATGTTGYTAGDTWFQRSGTTVIAQWEFTTSWQPRQINHQVIASIDAGKITVGTLDVENRIAARAVTADKVLIGDTTNYFPDRYLELGVTTWGPGPIVTDLDPPAGGNAILWSGSVSGHAPQWPRIQSEPGDEFVVEYTAKPIEGTNASMGLWGIHTISHDVIADLGDGWLRRRYVGRVVTPREDGERLVYLKTNPGAAAFTDIVVRRRTAGELIVDGAITADKVAANAITADKVAANAITGEKIAARSITAENLLVSGLDNFFTDPNFSHPDGYAPWTVVDGGIEKNGSASAEGGVYASTEFPVTAGDRLTVSAVRTTLVPGTNVTPAIRFYRYNNGVAGGWVNVWGGSGSSAAPEGRSFGGVGYIVPEGVTHLRLGFFTHGGMSSSARVRISDVTVYRMAESELIVNGAITTHKIAANAVVADKIDAGAVTAVKIGAGAVTADKIDANAVTADKISANAVTAAKIQADALNGKTITGATIRTSASNPRTELTSSGLRQFDSDGNVAVQMGHGQATGMSIRNPTTGAQVPLSSTAFGGRTIAQTNSLAFNAPANETPASSGGPGHWNAYTRHSADALSLTFRAEAGRYLVNWGQAWACNYMASGGASLKVRVAPRLNGTILSSTNGGIIHAEANMQAFSTRAEARTGVASGSTVISVTAGLDYNLDLVFQTNGYGPSPIVSSVANRFITITPIFTY